MNLPGDEEVRNCLINLNLVGSYAYEIDVVYFNTLLGQYVDRFH